MTEDEWEQSSDPAEMIEFLCTLSTSHRKMVLFAIGCCRRIWSLIADSRSRRGIEIKELQLDGLASEQERVEADAAAHQVWAEMATTAPFQPEGPFDPHSSIVCAAYYASRATSASGAELVARACAEAVAYQIAARNEPAWTLAYRQEQHAQCELLREVFGFVFRPVRINPSWLASNGSDACQVAQDIYQEGNFDQLPRLAEALSRAGCNDEVILTHCRAPIPHVRGCWVIDALLDKESPVRVGLVTHRDWFQCDEPWPLLEFFKDRGSDRKYRLMAVACCRRIWHLITDSRSRTAVEVAEQFADGQADQMALDQAREAAEESLNEAVQASDEAEGRQLMAEYRASSCPDPHEESRLVKDAVKARIESNRSDASYYAAGAALAALSVKPQEPDGFLLGSWDFACMANERAVSAAFHASTRVPASWQVYYQVNEEDANLRTKPEIEESTVADLLRDIFGDLLGPLSEQSAWLPFRDEDRMLSPTNAENWPPLRRCFLPQPLRITILPSWLTANNGAAWKIAHAIYEEERFDSLPVLADALEEAGCTDAVILNHCREPSLHVRGCWVVDQVLGKT